MLSNQEMMDQIDFIFKHNPQITLIFTDNKKGFRALRYRGMFQGREDIDLENGFTRSASAGFQKENSFLDEYQIHNLRNV